jgi:signal transduction histidine kinase
MKDRAQNKERSMQETGKERDPSSSRDPQMQNLQYVGLIINAIIHSFNNSIGLIHGYADLSVRVTEPDSRAHRFAKNIIDGVNSLKELSDKMVIFGKQEKQDYQLIPIQPIVERAINSLSMPATSSDKIQSDLDPACGAVLADADQIQQVVINLCNNAYDAMQGNSGTIKVFLKEVDVKAPSSEGQQDLGEGRYVKLTVSDTGCGMTQEVSDRIFEPFFTATKAGENVGLGLTVVRAIVKGHKGKITVKSKPGEGATFDIYLPLANRDNKKIAS